MSINDLSSENLIQIVRYLGSDFFRQDPGCLTLSRSWHALAEPVLYEEFHLGQGTLERFLTACDSKRFLSNVQQNLVCFRLTLEGFRAQGGHNFEYSEYEYQPVTQGEHPNRRWRRMRMYYGWRSTLHMYMSKLLCILERCERLKVLKLDTTFPIDPCAYRYIGYHEFLRDSTIQDFLNLKHLTMLHIDFRGSTVRKYSEGVTIESACCRNEGSHICETINSLLPRLQSLRCRMWDMCGRMLALSEGNAPLPLKELIVNMNLDRSVLVGLREGAGICTPGRNPALWGVAEAMMIRQARALAARLNSPRMVRVLYGRYSGRARSMPRRTSDTLSFDVLTGLTMILPMPVDWAADGELMNENPLDRIIGAIFSLDSEHSAQS